MAPNPQDPCAIDHWDVKSVVQVSGGVCLHQREHVSLLIGKLCALSMLPQFNQFGQMHWLVKNCCMLQIQRGPLACVLIQWVIYCSMVLRYAATLWRESISIIWHRICVEYSFKTEHRSNPDSLVVLFIYFRKKKKKKKESLGLTQVYHAN